VWAYLPTDFPFTNDGLTGFVRLGTVNRHARPHQPEAMSPFEVWCQAMDFLEGSVQAEPQKDCCSLRRGTGRMPVMTSQL